MAKDDIIKTATHSALSTSLKIGGEVCLVTTKSTGRKNIVIVSRVRCGGQIAYEQRTGYGSAPAGKDKADVIEEHIRKQHLRAVRDLKAGKLAGIKPPARYLEETKKLLRENRYKKALGLLEQAHSHYPHDPFVLSYYGCLTAIVGKDYDRGIETCRRAIKNLNKRLPFGQEYYYPAFYLNLGRAYFASGDRRAAVTAFKRGLKADSGNRDLLWEMGKLGHRRTPLVPFAKRGSPINKYIGFMLHGVTKKR